MSTLLVEIMTRVMSGNHYFAKELITESLFVLDEFYPESTAKSKIYTKTLGIYELKMPSRKSN